jgi:hypothetical protein
MGTESVQCWSARLKIASSMPGRRRLAAAKALTGALELAECTPKNAQMIVKFIRLRARRDGRFKKNGGGFIIVGLM